MSSKVAPPEEQRVCSFALLAEPVDHVGLVAVFTSAGREPAPSGVDHPVDGDVLGDDQVSHVRSSWLSAG
jgi:hypothetical protein